VFVGLWEWNFARWSWYVERSCWREWLNLQWE